MNKTLIFIPTYNEKDNVRPLYDRIKKLNLQADILFLDDNSPDGTGAIMDSIRNLDASVHVIHRSGKLGIGSAHKEGILWAYKNGVETLVTMDADFTHTPESIPDLIRAAKTYDIGVASRYLQEDSLKGWNLMRKGMTNLAHILTGVLLGLKYDSTGAFRVYQLKRIPMNFVSHVESNGYSFFFESLYHLNRSGFEIVEMPIALPPRTYGSSKMSYFEIFRSVKQLFTLFFKGLFQPKIARLDSIKAF